MIFSRVTIVKRPFIRKDQDTTLHSRHSLLLDRHVKRTRLRAAGPLFSCSCSSVIISHLLEYVVQNKKKQIVFAVRY